MSSLGVHFAIDDETASRLSDAEGDAQVLAVVEEIEEMAAVDRCDTDTAWDAIHRSLTDGRLAHDNGEYPLNAAVLGGRRLYLGDDYVVTYLDPHHVREVGDALTLVDRARLRAGYEALDTGDYGPEHGDDDFEYTWESFTELVAFFRRAAQTGKHVIFTA